jgi:hypothetical protein
LAQQLPAQTGSNFMETASPVFEDRQVSIGRVFQRAFAAVALNPLVILGLALVVGALPGLLMTYVFVNLGVTSSAALENGTFSTGSFIALIGLTTIVGMIISALVQGALTRATVSANEGRRATIGESLSAGLRVILPLIGLSILFAFGVAIGFVLLVVPGIILLLMWAVAVPTLVIERGGVFHSFRRSAELTKGARWKIFGLFCVLIAIYWLLTVVLGVVGLTTYGSDPATNDLQISTLFATLLVGTVFNALWGTIQPSLYVELRQWKEGGSLENLEQVFA